MKDKEGDLDSLSDLKSGQKAVIVELDGGKGFVKHLSDMGLRKGSEVEIISNRGGPVLIRCGETRFAIGHDMARRIYVKIL